MNTVQSYLEPNSDSLCVRSLVKHMLGLADAFEPRLGRHRFPEHATRTKDVARLWFLTSNRPTDGLDRLLDSI